MCVYIYIYTITIYPSPVHSNQGYKRTTRVSHSAARCTASRMVYGTQGHALPGARSSSLIIDLGPHLLSFLDRRVPEC